MDLILRLDFHLSIYFKNSMAEFMNNLEQEDLIRHLYWTLKAHSCL